MEIFPLNDQAMVLRRGAIAHGYMCSEESMSDGTATASDVSDEDTCLVTADFVKARC